jgi:hypothetical protein
MSKPRACALLLPFLLLACGGATTSEPESDPASEKTTASPPATSTTSPKDPSTTAPAPPFTANPASTVDFHATLISARREPSANAACGQKNAPFTDDDTFLLQVVGTSTSKSAQFQSVVIVFKRTVPLAVAQTLAAEAPDRFGTQAARSPAISLTVFGNKGMGDTPLPTPIDGATVTVLEVAQAEGAALTARIQLHFESGASFDATISGKLESSEGACAGGAGGAGGGRDG